MRRLQDYFRFLVWQSGLGYAALWIVTFWTLDYGPAIFNHAAGCHPDQATVMFYWACDPASPLSFLATIANTALTVTVWAPVYLAAATVRPDAISIAGPILAAHVIGLPAIIFITIRLMLQFFLLPRRLARKMQMEESESGSGGGAAIELETAEKTLSSILETRAAPRPQSIVKPRETFGLRKLGQA